MNKEWRIETMRNWTPEEWDQFVDQMVFVIVHRQARAYTWGFVCGALFVWSVFKFIL